MRQMEIRNSGWPNVYSCNFIEPGIVSYEDSDSGIALVTKEALDKMMPSFIGKPVVINHQKITPENYGEMKSSGTIVGHVIKTYYNPTDGWFWCDFIVDTDEGKKRIEQHLDKVSCAYTVLDAQDGGLWHDIKYDGEITDGAFTHLALVENPRYEGSEITKQLPAMLVNGKAAHFINQEEGTIMKFDFFKKKADGTKEAIDPLVLINGKECSLSEVLNSLIEKLNAEGEMRGIQAKDTDLVDINGTSYDVGTLKNCMAEKIKNDKEKEEKEKEASKKNGTDDKDAGGKDEFKEAEEKKKNDKTKEEEALKGKEEDAAKKKNEKEEEEKKEKENSKKKGDEFFNSLNDLSLYTGDGSDGYAAPAPKTRQDRANEKRAQVNKQFVGR